MNVALQWLFASAAALAIGVGLGALSGAFFVIGLWSIATGLAVGIARAAIALTASPRARGAATARGLGWVAAAAAVCLGWGAFQLFEDAHFRDGHRLQAARRLLVGDAVPPGVISEDAAAELVARKADAELEALVVASVGEGGYWGRWRFRAGVGVRLVGPVEGGRGLAVGEAGAIAFALVEIALAWMLALVVTARALRMARAPGAGPGPEVESDSVGA